MSITNQALLIVAYQRREEVSQILEVALSAGITRVYAVIDIEKSLDRSAYANQIEMKKVFLKYKNDCEILKVHLRTKNVGCAVSVVTGADWIFKYEDTAVVLEDDCIPESTFFQYCNATVDLLKHDRETMLACGSQFVPSELLFNNWYKSKYALTWGWFTTSSKWKEISNYFTNSQIDISNKSSVINLFAWPKYENDYWSAGEVRARRGIVDVWDTILVSYLFSQKKFSILPPAPLVSNVGDDRFATHTHNSPWLHTKMRAFEASLSTPEMNERADLWLRDNFYRIGFRHTLSTRLHEIIDVLYSASSIPLSTRIRANSIA